VSETTDVPVEVEAAPAAEIAEPVSFKEEAAEPQVEVETAPAEEEVVETAAPEVESAPVADTSSRFDSLMDALGDIPDEPNAQLLENIDERSIEKLPDSMKGLMKHLIAQQRVQAKQAEAQYTERQSALDKRMEEIENQNKILIRNRAQLNQVLLDPKFQEYLKMADTPEEELPDPMSNEGIEARIKKGVAQAMRQFQEPIQQSARRAQQLAAYQDFVDANPKMQDAQFKSDVRQLMEQRKESGNSISLPDAYALVERKQLVAAQEKQSAKERLRRRESAQQVQRSTISSTQDNNDPVPKWVTEKGYKGIRGNTARILYLRDNPKALQALRAQQKSR
tara:strand:- start:1849 stop:2859 length:1011 start_codon:yes stop_codon:yes gene_type:complete